ncbi:hypothetical protein [Methanococcoides seepicolus]|uniref:Uncharacterized protein n=1 Tax=Methanococcoides seepicolus TaxID=2828780 RepID=A0A9E4ZGD7_9EURY|nr:hypothetical protein [Methanococcoides seepicolus]MCM1987212.1 hypothetical protein [Methanococcoides seepicolus]
MFDLIFQKKSSAIFDSNSTETFGGATAQMFLLAKELGNYIGFDVSSIVVDFGRKDGKNGYLIKYDDVDGLANRINKIEKDTPTKDIFSKYNREMICIFDHENICRKYLEEFI